MVWRTCFLLFCLFPTHDNYNPSAILLREERTSLTGSEVTVIAPPDPHCARGSPLTPRWTDGRTDGRAHPRPRAQVAGGREGEGKQGKSVVALRWRTHACEIEG